MIALIPARGGSKGLPRKNVLPLLGKPLIAYTIDAARRCPFISRTIVSTDDAEIAEVARRYGAEVPFIRPSDLATDTASSKDTVLHALEFLGSEGVERFCLLQPTSPLRNTNDITNAVELFQAKQADSVLSVVEFEHPIQWALEMDAERRMQSREKDAVGMRQGAKVYFRPNGAIYVFNKAFFTTAESYIGSASYAYVMPQERSVDIDTKIDFLLAEAIMKGRRKDAD